MSPSKTKIPTAAKVVGFICLVAVLLWQGHGFRFLSVQSDSMAPRFHTGDIVFIRNAILYDTKIGDIVSVASPEDPSVVVTHRVAAVDPINGLVTTKGDANEASDQPVGGQQLRGRVLAVLPGFGRLANFLHSWWGVVAIVYTPLALLVFHEFIRLIQYYVRPTYQVPGRVRGRVRV